MGLSDLLSRDALPTAARQEVNDYADEFKALRSADDTRLRRMHDYRQELESARECNPRDDYGDYGRTPKVSDTARRHSIALPYGMALTVKHANRIAGPQRIPEAVVERRDSTPEESYRSDTMEKIYWGCFRASDGQQQLASAAWDSSGLGAAALEPYFDIKSQMAKFRALDPESILVVRGVDNPHEFARAYRFWKVPLATLRADYRGETYAGLPTVVDQIKGDNTGCCEIVQLKTKTRCIRFVIDGGNVIPIYEREENYGFVPLVIIPNLGPERRVWGWADYEFVRALCHYIPKLFGREADILRFVANGAFKAKGTKQSAQAIAAILAKGGVLPTGKDGDVEPIEVPQVPQFEEAHAQRSITMLQDLGFSPPAAWGAGGAGSGSDRGLQLAPAAELAQMKQVNWASALGRLGGMLFQMIEAKQVGTVTYSGIQRKGFRKQPFTLQLDPNHDVAREQAQLSPDDTETAVLPRSPKELFAGDYTIEFTWQNRNDPDDPAYVASELNKFAQGVQSLQTTLERLGVQAPEDEIKLIQAEADKYPWIRQGMLKLLELQFNQMNGQSSGQGAGGGGDQRSGADLMSGALDTMTGGGGGASGALNADAGNSALPGSTKPLYGAA